MINSKYVADDARGLSLALPVPEGTKNGVPTTLGTSKLLVVPQTDRATAELRKLGRVPQGLENGQATCFIPGVSMVLELGTIPNGVVAFDKLYLSAANVLTTTNTDTFVGWAIPLPAPYYGLGVGVRSN